MNFYDLVIKWEGGLGVIADETAQGGYSNCGVSVSLFYSLSKKLLNVEPTFENFKKLNVYQVQKFIDWFYKTGNLEQIKSNAIKYYLLDFFWGSGYWAWSNVVKVLNNVYGYSFLDKGKNTLPTSNILQAINKQNASNFLDDISEQRILFLNTIGKQPTKAKYLKGWLNRETAFYKFSKKFIQKNFANSILIFGLFAAGLLFLKNQRHQN